MPIAGGPTVTLVLGNVQTGGLAQDAGNLYFWATSPNGIAKVAKTGGATMAVVTTTAAPNLGIACDGTNIVWCEQGNGVAPGTMALVKATTAGTGVTVLAGTVANTSTLTTVLTNPAIDASNVYFVRQSRANFVTNTLEKVPLGGGATTVLGTSQNGFAVDDQFALAATYLYWVTNGAVLRVPIAGGASTSITATGTLSGLTAVTVDASSAFVTDGPGGLSVAKVPVSATGPTAPTVGWNTGSAGGATRIASDATTLYFSTTGGVLFRASKF